MSLMDQQVKVLTGKYKGKVGIVGHRLDGPDILSRNKHTGKMEYTRKWLVYILGHWPATGAYLEFNLEVI